MAAISAQSPKVPDQESELYQVQKMKEELQIKSNLDYENRLRGHMYQFEEGMKRNSNPNNLPQVKGKDIDNGM